MMTAHYYIMEMTSRSYTRYYKSELSKLLSSQLFENVTRPEEPSNSPFDVFHARPTPRPSGFVEVFGPVKDREKVIVKQFFIL